jgi:hypothetical protein
VRNFVAAWTKVMLADRFDLTRSYRDDSSRSRRAANLDEQSPRAFYIAF